MILRTLLSDFFDKNEEVTQLIHKTNLKETKKIVQEPCEQESTTTLLFSDQIKNVLLVEDNLINQKVAAIQLKTLGYSVNVAENGIKALQALKSNLYGLIFMDCLMPEMDGYQTTIQIRKNEVITGNHVPIIALTGRDLEEDQEKCFAVGMNGYLAKPIVVDELIKVLYRWYPSEKVKKASGSFERPTI